VSITPGNEHDINEAENLIEGVYDCYILADRGYDSDKFRTAIRSANCIPVIPGRKNRKNKIEYDKQLYKKRNLIERIFGKIKEKSRLAMRKDKHDHSFLSMIAIALTQINNLC